MKQSWLKGWLSGKPHFIIGNEDNPYMLRWYIIPRNKFLNIYLHKFLRDDDDRALHDHPWHFFSFMLSGAYKEITEQGILIRRVLSFAYRSALHRHRVELFKDTAGKVMPCWTVVCTGKSHRTWGFWCPKGFVKWTDFVAPTDSGQIGNGCD
jgi:hypothetical protein